MKLLNMTDEEILIKDVAYPDCLHVLAPHTVECIPNSEIDKEEVLGLKNIYIIDEEEVSRPDLIDLEE